MRGVCRGYWSRWGQRAEWAFARTVQLGTETFVQNSSSIVLADKSADLLILSIPTPIQNRKSLCFQKREMKTALCSMRSRYFHRVSQPVFLISPRVVS